MFQYLFTHTPLFYFTQSFWRDEAFSYVLAKKNIIDIILLTVKDFNPPFYYLILHFWMNIFGKSEIIIRSLSLLFYVLTIYIIYDFLRDVLKLGKYKTFIYLLLFIFNPVLIYYAFEARMYSMLAFFSTASFYFFITKRKKYYLLVSILGLYTHYFMSFVLLSQLLYYLIYHKTTFKLKTILFPFFTFSPWLLFMLFQKKDIFNPFWIETTSIKGILLLPFILLTGFEDWLKITNSYVYFSYILILIISIGVFKFLTKKNFQFFLIWTFFPLIITGIVSLFRPIILPRYLIYCTIGFNFLIIYILSNIKLIPRIIFFTFIALFLFNYQKINLKQRKKTNLASKIREIKSLAKKGDLLYVSSELDYFTAAYYFDENRVFIFNKTYEEIPGYVGKILIPREKVVNILPLYPQRAFILKNNGNYDIIAKY